MRRTLLFVIFLALILGALYILPKKEKFFNQQNVLGIGIDNQGMLKGRIYSDPQGHLFLVDLDGDLYGLDFEDDNKELIETSNQVKNSGSVIEVIGKIEKDNSNYGEKKIEASEIRNIQKENSGAKKDFYTKCQNQEGKVEFIKVCKFSNGQICILEDFLKGRCLNK